MPARSRMVRRAKRPTIRGMLAKIGKMRFARKIALCEVVRGRPCPSDEAGREPPASICAGQRHFSYRRSPGTGRSSSLGSRLAQCLRLAEAS